MTVAWRANHFNHENILGNNPKFMVKERKKIYIMGASIEFYTIDIATVDMNSL